MLWAWNVDIFVRLDLRGWAPPPATHYHFNHWTTSTSISCRGRTRAPGCLMCIVLNTQRQMLWSGGVTVDERVVNSADGPRDSHRQMISVINRPSSSVKRRPLQVLSTSDRRRWLVYHTQRPLLSSYVDNGRSTCCAKFFLSPEFGTSCRRKYAKMKSTPIFRDTRIFLQHSGVRRVKEASVPKPVRIVLPLLIELRLVTDADGQTHSCS